MASGQLTGFSHTVIGDGGNLVAGGVKNDHYDIPHQFAEWRETSHGIRLKHWRSVGHGPNKFAIESLLDTIAFDQRVDPINLRRTLMTQSPKALATLEKAVAMSRLGCPLNRRTRQRCGLRRPWFDRYRNLRNLR